ncbi:hypothetical protein KC614_03635 [candidate division WWE3 bacterium]|uniref:SGNH hydrolase-type esterase domain-containing protein n=1 Tax=candidate division WWE3 bacterium TaxID=2053526 RepID=A0A955LKW0_UNCKA|nr:hypothetical protein [candidate division WWE3 bacterium]
MLPGSIAFYGASSVYGVGDLQEGGFVNRFRKWYDKNRSDGVVYNLGIPAENSDYLVSRFLDENDRRNPEVVFFDVGTNDAHRQPHAESENYVDIDKFKANLNALIQLATNAYKIGFITPYLVDEMYNPRSGVAYFLNDDIKTYTQAIYDTVDNTDIMLIDVLAHWQSEDDYSALMSSDGLHASEAGHQVICNLIIEKLSSTYLNL